MYNTFLAANSTSGFYSLFEELIEKDDHNIILIKGGPGTGKSGLMKKVAVAADEKGYTVEQMHCSSDPASLDGVWVKEKKLVLLDATAPHCYDPKYPGAVEQILPLGEYWQRDKLIPHRTEIIGLTQSISAIFGSIYKMLGAVGELREMADKVLKNAFNTQKATALLTKFFSHSAVVPQRKKGKTEKRFISALTGGGEVLYEDIIDSYERVLLIEDGYDGAHHLTALADKMLASMGYDRIRLCCPLMPEHIDHLLLPECSLAILTQNQRLQWQRQLPVVKTIHLRSLMDADILSAHKNKLNFVKKLSRSLCEEVSEYLSSEKALHDELEKYYINAMDFDTVNAKTAEIITKYL